MSNPKSELQHFIFLILICLWFCLQPVWLPAQEDISKDSSNLKGPFSTTQTENRKALTETQVLDQALQNSRKLTALNTNVEIADNRAKSNGIFPNPELRMSNLSTRNYSADFDELRLGLRLRFPKIGELAEEKQQGQVDFWNEKVDQIRYRHELIARVRRNFADVIMLDSLAQLDQKRVDLENKRLNIIEEMVELGNRSVVYFTKAKMMNQESKNTLARTLQKQKLARWKLSKRTGISVESILSSEELPVVTQDLDQLLQIAYKNRPEIVLVQERIELAVKQKKLELLKVIPWPTFVEFSYHREKNRTNDWAEFIMGLNLPIFDLNIGNIRATKIAVRKKEDELDGIRESIEDEVRDAYILYKDLYLDWNNSRADAAEMIAGAQEVIKQARIHQTLITDEIFEMEWTIIDTQKLLVEKRFNLAEALAELYFALGVEKYEQLTKQGD